MDFGDIYGNLTYIRELERTGVTRWGEFACGCGELTKKRILDVNNGKTRSCGCIRKSGLRHVTHGHSLNGKVSSTYRTWYAMLQRCGNENDRAYHNYGARGISVCDKWNSFIGFLDDMGERPAKNMSLDRKENDGNYEISNCRWATKKEQTENRRITLRVLLSGEFISLVDACENHNRDYHNAYYNIVTKQISADAYFNKQKAK